MQNYFVFSDYYQKNKVVSAANENGFQYENDAFTPNDLFSYRQTKMPLGVSSDIKNLNISVEPGIVTVIQGTVYDENKNSIENARIEPTSFSSQSIENVVVSDKNGKYIMHYLGGKEVPEYRSLNIRGVSKKDKTTVKPFDAHYDKCGEKNVYLTFGQVNSCDLELKDVNRTSAAVKIIADPSIDLSSMKVEMYNLTSQTNSVGKLTKDSVFQFTELVSGEHILTARSPEITIQHPKYGTRVLNQYCINSKIVYIKTDDKEHYVEATLKKASFIAGQILTSQKIPKTNIKVKLRGEGGGSDITDNNGFFWITNLDQEKKYELDLYQGTELIRKGVFMTLAPGTDNVEITQD